MTKLHRISENMYQDIAGLPDVLSWSQPRFRAEFVNAKNMNPDSCGRHVGGILFVGRLCGDHLRGVWVCVI